MKFLFSFLVLYIVCQVDPCTRHKYIEITHSHHVEQGGYITNQGNNANGQPGEGDGDHNNEPEPEPEESDDVLVTAQQQKPCTLCCNTGKRATMDLSDPKTFQQAVQLLWHADKHRLDFHIWQNEWNGQLENEENVLAFQMYRADKRRQNRDQAFDQLIKNVTKTVWTEDPANEILKRLFAAYDGNKWAEAERLGNELLDNLTSSNHVFKLLQAILKDCGKTSDFMPYMRNLWFGKVLKPHLPKPESSGFRHVFVGELNRHKRPHIPDNTVVDGQHNWLRYLYIQTGQSPYDLKYTGYIAKVREDGPHDIKAGRVANIEYYLTLKSERSSHSSERYWRDSGNIIFGTGIAFDLGLHTLAGAAKPGEPIKFFLGDCAPAIVTAVVSRSPYERLYSAYTSPWIDAAKLKHPCPDYIQAGKQYESEMNSGNAVEADAEDDHGDDVGGTSQGTGIPIVSNVVHDDEDDLYGTYYHHP